MNESVTRLKEMQQEYQETANIIRSQWEVCDSEHREECERAMRHARNIEYMSNCLGIAALCLENDA